MARMDQGSQADATAAKSLHWTSLSLAAGRGLHADIVQTDMLMA